DNYRPVIYYLNEEQKEIAEKSRQALENSGRFNKPIVTQIEPAQTFYPAEMYHQDFYKKNPENFARNHAKRAAFIKENWGE
ncbi:MAG: peptide-methionine (S)-S-oxide reductase, partial [Tetragenococcus halophilus]|nr:peptide-methionine (S)-S-oxide reductase [Tetragenococcus halophilus]MDN6142451.1 peptide-methionine (S)-S-oxide reductase [Tetragenococcus halophilus]MDN6568566.1 peptide-methionine (S)-S-oxide reductase [Tetragenococcus halophilus]